MTSGAGERDARREHFGNEALAFAVLRGLTLVAGGAALFIFPLNPEHRVHLAPLLAAFVLYNAAVVGVLTRWAGHPRPVFLVILAADLVLVFVLVWFTGGGASPYYLVFYLLVTLNAYYFGPVIGVGAALGASALVAVANWLVPMPASWLIVGSRAIILGVLGLSLGHVANRERSARARAEGLSREMETTLARLARAEQLAAVGRFSAKMAHEVRNPLGSITLNVDMLSDLLQPSAGATATGTAAAEAQELLRSIRTEITVLASLTDEYLTAAHLPAPRIEKHWLNPLVTELVGLLGSTATQHGVALETRLDATLPPLAFDRTMLRLALRNLIKNGIEAVGSAGRVCVSTSGDAANAYVTVEDGGGGIAPDTADRIFEPFFTTKPGGTGLGLSIAEEIARQHGGDLTWRSDPGAGARFTIRLPVAGPSHA